MPNIISKRKKLYRPIYATSGALCEIDLQTGGNTRYAVTAGAGDNLTAKATKDGNYVIMMGNGIRVYHQSNLLTPITSYSGAEGNGYSLILTPDGKTAITWATSGNMNFFDLTPAYKASPSAPTLLAQKSGIANGGYSGRVTSDNSKLIFTSGADLCIMSLATRTITKTISNVIGSAFDVALSPDETIAYVNSAATTGIKKVDINAGTITTLTTTASTTRQMDITPDGTKLLVATTGLVNIYNTSTGGLITSVGSGIGSYGISVSPDGRYAVSANYFGGAASTVINLDTNSVLYNSTPSPTFLPMTCYWIIR